MLAALSLIFAGAAAQAGVVPVSPHYMDGHWQIVAHSTPRFVCRLTQRDMFVSGDCAGAGFHSTGFAFGWTDGKRIFLSLRLPTGDGGYMPFDLDSTTVQRDGYFGTMLTPDGRRETFTAGTTHLPVPPPPGVPWPMPKP